jgi:hypothetical protein
MADYTPASLAPEEAGYLMELLLALQPMGGYTVDGIDVCGARNVPPSEPSIRQVLQRASEAEAHPVALYQQAVAVYERLDADRRQQHPAWTWPAPPYEAVGPATWLPLEPEVPRSIHELRVASALRANGDPRRIERLRAVLARAQGRGLDPEALYRDVTARLGPADLVTPPIAPPYDLVKPQRPSGAL